MIKHCFKPPSLVSFVTQQLITNTDKLAKLGFVLCFHQSRRHPTRVPRARPAHVPPSSYLLSALSLPQLDCDPNLPIRAPTHLATETSPAPGSQTSLATDTQDEKAHHTQPFPTGLTAHRIKQQSLPECLPQTRPCALVESTLLQDYLSQTPAAPSTQSACLSRCSPDDSQQHCTVGHSLVSQIQWLLQLLLPLLSPRPPPSLG